MTASEKPTFRKSPPELIARFADVAGRHPEGRQRKMFGYPALFVRGNYAAGLYEDHWVVRLAPDDLELALSLPGGSPFSPMPGRGMKGWASLPDDVVADDARLDAWIDRALDFAASLPPKGA
ncbi:MAG: TfoX/Sxy family protein [Chloroflexi bacterium]|jgi:TfoX/Sxy family transcriptional regulator of competence genes|nr:TfoX/Sxy family protein [Chloroflexota bacterium]